jgi:hypothetical protein
VHAIFSRRLKCLSWRTNIVSETVIFEWNSVLDFLKTQRDNESAVIVLILEYWCIIARYGECR